MKFLQGAPAPANAVDAGSILGEFDLRTSGILLFVIELQLLKRLRAAVGFVVKTVRWSAKLVGWPHPSMLVHWRAHAETLPVSHDLRHYVPPTAQRVRHLQGIRSRK